MSKTVMPSICGNSSARRYASMTVNSGCSFILRGGSTFATTSSNETSAFAIASRSARRTSSRTAAKRSVELILVRNATVPTIIPATLSSAGSFRRLTAAPTTTSSVTHSRASSTAITLWTTMNTVTPCERANADNAS